MKKLTTAKPAKAKQAPVTPTVPIAAEPTSLVPIAARKRFCGVAGRSGAPKGNSNATRHGLKGGKLPKGCQYIENTVNELRRQVEDAVMEAKGVINFVDAAAVNSILKWERHGALATHWLRHEASNLSIGDRLKFSEQIAKASDNRDRAIRSLQLGMKPSPWITLPSQGEGKEENV